MSSAFSEIPQNSKRAGHITLWHITQVNDLFCLLCKTHYYVSLEYRVWNFIVYIGCFIIFGLIDENLKTPDLLVISNLM